MGSRLGDTGSPSSGASIANTSNCRLIVVSTSYYSRPCFANAVPDNVYVHDEKSRLVLVATTELKGKMCAFNTLGRSQDAVDWSACSLYRKRT